MSQKAKLNPYVDEAESILRGQAATPQHICDLAMVLKKTTSAGMRAACWASLHGSISE